MSATNGLPLRGPRLCSSSATPSLPLPLSPRISAGHGSSAARCASASSASIDGDSATSCEPIALPAASRSTTASSVRPTRKRAPERTTARSTRTPLTNVPLRLPRSRTKQTAPGAARAGSGARSPRGRAARCRCRRRGRRAADGRRARSLRASAPRPMTSVSRRPLLVRERQVLGVARLLHAATARHRRARAARCDRARARTCVPSGRWCARARFPLETSYATTVPSLRIASQWRSATSGIVDDQVAARSAAELERALRRATTWASNCSPR